MDLGRYIHQLLKHRKEVYVKGLGVFKRMHTPSVYDERKRIYLPPVTYLEFDGKGTGGVDFIEYFQQSKQLSRSDAELEVESAVLGILEKVKNDGIARLTHVGQLVRHGTSLVFKAEDLGGFQLQPVAAASPSGEADGQLENLADVEQDIVQSSQASNPLESGEEEAPAGAAIEDETDTTVNGRPRWFLWVAVLAAIVIAGLFYFNRNTSDESRNLGSGDLDSNSTVQGSLSDSTVTTAATDSATDSTEAKVYSPLIPEHHTYQIVIGTHNTLAQAYEQAESFNKAGVPSVRVIPSKLANNKKRVIWDTYETKTEADSALRYVRRYHVSDAWHQEINQ